MKKKNQVNISIFTTKWGHFSIGKAIEETLKENPSFKTYFNFIPVEKMTDLTYLPVYRLFPSAFKYAFKAGEQEKIAKILTTYLNQRYKKMIELEIKEQRPKVVINTYLGFNQLLEKYSKIYNFLYINIVPDPRTLHKLSLTNIGYNFVFDKKAEKACLNNGIDKDKTIVSGWFVRKDFKPEQNQADIRKGLGIAEDTLTFLIVGGSSGNYSILKTLPALVSPEHPLQVIYISGDSKTLYRGTKVISELFSNHKLKIKSVGFTNRLYDYIKASDIVIGKAGPNLLFETVAVQKPFIAISHIHGQEDGNLDIINDYKLGIAEENQIKVIKLLKKLINDPKKLASYKRGVKKMAETNNNSPKILTDFIMSHIKS